MISVVLAFFDIVLLVYVSYRYYSAYNTIATYNKTPYYRTVLQCTKSTNMLTFTAAMCILSLVIDFTDNVAHNKKVRILEYTKSNMYVFLQYCLLYTTAHNKLLRDYIKSIFVTRLCFYAYLYYLLSNFVYATKFVVAVLHMCEMLFVLFLLCSTKTKHKKRYVAYNIVLPAVAHVYILAVCLYRENELDGAIKYHSYLTSATTMITAYTIIQMQHKDMQRYKIQKDSSKNMFTNPYNTK